MACVSNTEQIVGGRLPVLCQKVFLISQSIKESKFAVVFALHQFNMAVEMLINVLSFSVSDVI